MVNGTKVIESENPDPKIRIGTACIGRSVTSLHLYDNSNFEDYQGVLTSKAVFQYFLACDT